MSKITINQVRKKRIKSTVSITVYRDQLEKLKALDINISKLTTLLIKEFLENNKNETNEKDV
tara:strand:+ start:1255 stop:1440 length:186 start_codon:yes stop_codon:yes gene_type:complete